MKFVLDRIVNGKETIKDVLHENTYSYGRLEVGDKCTGCGKCIDKCIVRAIELKDEKAVVDCKKCVYCRNCLEECSKGAIEMTSDYKMASLEHIGEDLRQRIYGKYRRSLVLRSVDTGSCNACMLELSAMQNNYYALSRFGVEFAASPRHADGIVVTGPVTLNMKEALLKTYHAMPEPRIVIAAGTCAYDGGIFKDSYGNFLELDKIIPVDLVIPGCPPSPQAIIYGLLKLMQKSK